MNTNGRRDDAHRVVVTGMGVVTPIGETPAEFSASLRAGRSGITRWEHMDERTLSKIGGDMCEFDLGAHFERVGARYPPDLIKRARTVLRATPLTGRLAGAAALQAYIDAGLHDAGLAPERVGHVGGGNNLNNNYFVQNVRLFEQDPESIDPLLGVVFWDTDVLGKIGELLTIKGPNYMVGNACASGNAALLCAIDLLRAGRVDTAVVSAATQELDPVALQGWALMNALVWQSFADAPTQASRPFDARRQGFVPGEAPARSSSRPLPERRRATRGSAPRCWAASRPVMRRGCPSRSSTVRSGSCAALCAMRASPRSRSTTSMPTAPRRSSPMRPRSRRSSRSSASMRTASRSTRPSPCSGIV